MLTCYEAVIMQTLNFAQSGGSGLKKARHITKAEEEDKKGSQIEFVAVFMFHEIPPSDLK